MKQEEPQIYGKYWRHETGDRYKQEKTEYRACRGDSWDREKKPGDPESPLRRRKRRETLNEKKEWGEESFVRKRHRERNRKPKPRQPGAGAGGEKVVQGAFMGTEVAIIVSFAISVLLFLAISGFAALSGSFLRSTLLGVFGVMGYLVPFLLFMGTCFIFQTGATRKP